ncbi:MAG: N-acetyl-gamma-glutamyl-phosphate reductase [Candidatus Omnitrophica bacterium]|nr:N-acetyl-gamma-glutamyl-phosphate reductase [Candidatus Omnitrophota bacterium]
MLKIAIVGATGYAGEEVLKILVNHPQVEVTSVSAKIDEPQRIDQIFPHFKGKIDLICEEPNFSKIVPDCDLAFLALPHRVSMKIAPKFLEAGKKVIDLSADYRLKEALVYEKWYGVKHENPQYLTQAVYGLPEVYRDKIKQAKLIANPGCYPTGIILGCLPFLTTDYAQYQHIIVDAKTGLSGAGREKEAELLPQMKDNFRAYKVDAHQHAPEINQELSKFSGQKLEVVFTPHLISIKRGILSTIYLQLKNEISQEDALNLYQDFYQDEPFVKVLPQGQFPQLKDVVKTNFCHIGLKINPAKKIAIVISAIDNLVKGASGQAVQNMNIMYGFKETEGLT